MKNRKILSVLLVFAMLITLIAPLVIVPVSADTPTLIYDQAGLAAMSATGNYKLANDITISGTWRNTILFKGTFDGDGHTITYAEGSTIRGGLFEQLQEGATVKNLYIVEGGTVHWTTAPDLPGNNGTACFGGLTGSIQASAGNFNTDSFIQNSANKVTIQNVHVNVTIYTESGTTGSAQVAVGGIVGDLGLITRIENCSFSGSISDSTNRSGVDGTSGRKHSGYGGMVGVIVRNCASIEIVKCVNNGDITGYGNQGGILGYSRSMGTRAVLIEQCINNGAIECKESAASSSVGGMIGYAYAVSTKPVTVRYCINTGAIKRASEDVPAAGIIGGLRRDADTIFLTGNLQDSASNQGSQIVVALDGSGDLVCENNYSVGGTTGSIYTHIDNAEEYAVAYDTLNAAYPHIYGMDNGHITLAWAVQGVTFLYDQSDLAAMSATGSYKLANDITITGTWRNTVLFKGTFDGDGHTITYAEGSTIRGGLFEQLQEGATVKNLYIVEGGTVHWTTAPDLPGNQSAACLGGLAASIQAGSGNHENSSFIQNAANKVTVQNVHVNVNIYTEAGTTGNMNLEIGGIAGDLGLTCRIENCSFSGSITDSTNRTGADMNRKTSSYGGMIGAATRNCGTIEIIKCVNNGNISGYGHEAGMLGYSRAWSGGDVGPTEIVIEQCINNGALECLETANSASVGGMIGFAYAKSTKPVTVRYCINTGSITKASDDVRAAGIIGGVRRDADTFFLTGNLQDSEENQGSQIAQTPEGSGDLVCENNYSIGGTTGSVYTHISGAVEYANAYATLNAAYPGIYGMYNGHITLVWMIPIDPSSEHEHNFVDGVCTICGVEKVAGGIYNQADLAAMGATGTYTLQNDITITGIWRNTTFFKGTFDGNGHTITYAAGSTIRGGLFEQLQEGATVRNLYIVEGGTVQWTTAPDLPGNNGTACFGGLTGSIQASAGNFETDSFIQNAANKVTIQNVHVNVNLYTNSGTTGSTQVAIGGIVGDVGLTCRIENCSFSGSITDSTCRNGTDMIAYLSGYAGIVGVAVRNCGAIEIIQCLNNGNISGYGQEGGIFGYSRPWSAGSIGPNSIVIQKCINNGTITCLRTSVDDSHHANVGGIAAYVYVKDSGTATIVNNVNNGDVIAYATEGDSYAAGIVSHLRRGAVNAFNISGNATRHDAVTTNGAVGRYINKPDGSGDIIYENNQAYGATPAGVSASWAVLNAIYPDVFMVSKDYTMSLKWAANQCAYLFEENYQKMFSLGLDGIIQLRIGVAIPGTIPSSLRLIVLRGEEEVQNVRMFDVYDEESGYYVVSVPILAKEMADANSYTMIVQNGGVTIWSTTQSISVKNYVAALKTHSEYSAWFELADAMLKYGAAAQNLFGYHTGALAADISGGITVDTASLPSYSISGDRSFLTQIRGSLSLEEGTDLNFYFKPSNPSANLTATVRKGGNVVSSGVVTEWVADDQGTAHVFLAVRILNLAADELDDWYDITVTDGSKSVTIHYSGLCWAKVILNDSTASAATKTLAKGIALYANKAIASVGNVEPLVIANADSASSYYISYPAGGDTYFRSSVLSIASKMSRKGIYVATSAGDNSALGKAIKIATNGSITGWQITFAANGSITVTGKDYQMATNGLRYLFDTMITRTSDGSYIIQNPTNVSNSATAYTRSGWLLAAPAYENGTLASALYDDGTGLATDMGTTVNAERSYVMYISSTNATQFNAYASKLVSNGYTLDASNSTTAKNGSTNLFKTYRKGTQVLFLYFDAQYNVARVIDDLASTPESEFEYTFSYTSSTSTDLILYGLKYNAQGYGPTDSGGDENTANNGELIIIKQADNSVMLIDGGVYLQATDTAVEGLWNYLHTITGASANAPITVSCWYVTHPHSDHFYLVHALLEKYHEKIDLQRVMFNFPKFEEDMGYQEDIRVAARAYYPNVKFMKCHTGQSIRLGSLTLDVLSTHEDLVTVPSAATIMEKGNDMTTVLRITFPDGSRYMCLGDATEDVVIDSMINHFASSELKCKFLDVPHHGYNEMTSSQCNAFAPTYVFYPNANYTNFPHPTIDTNNVKWRYRHCKNNHDYLQSAGASNFYYAGSGTYRLTISNGSVSVSSTSVVP